MIKILYHLLYFLVPFFLYFLWVILSNSNFTKRATFWVSLVSVVALVSSLVFFRINDNTFKDYDYVPPKVIDGDLRDGYFKENNE